MSVPMHKTVRMTFWFLLALLLIVPATPVAAQSTPPPFLFECGKVDGHFTTPRDVAVSQDGYAYVTDGAEHRVQIFDENGNFEHSWGSYGSGRGQFNEPWGVAVDERDGVVYVVDSGNARVQVFERDGSYIGEWGTFGSNSGQFDQPAGIAIHSDRVYVADAGNHRIQVFDRRGEYQYEIGAPGNGPGRLNHPTGVALDANGNVYVAEEFGQRIEKFDRTGVSIRDRNLGLQQPTDLIVANYRGSERVFLTIRGTDEIQTLDLNLNLGAAFGVSGIQFGEFDEPVGIGADRNGSVYIADSQNHRVQVFDFNGSLVNSFGGGAITPNGLVAPAGQLNRPHDVAIDSDGNIYVADTGNHRIVKYDADCNYLDSWGELNSVDFISSNNDPVWLFGPQGVAVDDNDRIWVADTQNKRIQAFDAGFNRFGWWPEYAPYPNSLPLIEDVAVSSSDQVYVSTSDDQIQLLDGNLRPFFNWNGGGTPAGPFDRPTGLALSSRDHLYVVDTGNDRMQLFDHRGNFQHVWGQSGQRNNEFDAPHGIDVTEYGYVYIADAGNHRIKVHDDRGGFLTAWGGYGAGAGQFNLPHGVAVNNINGRVYVADTNNNRIQVFGGNNLPRSAAPSNAPTVAAEQPAIFLPLVARQTP